MARKKQTSRIYRIYPSLEVQKVIHDYVVHQIEREDGLVNYRLTWMLTTQALLFAAFVTLSSQVEGTLPEPLGAVLSYLMPTTGLILGLGSFLGVFAAYRAIRDLRTTWYDNVDYKKFVQFVRPFGDHFPHWLGTVTSMTPPFMVIVVWGVVLAMLVVFSR